MVDDTVAPHLDIEEHVGAVVMVGDRARVVARTLSVRRCVVGVFTAANLQ